MPRHPAPAAQIIDPATPESTAAWSDSANAQAQIMRLARDAAQAIALQVGYDGTLTIGALEDEIRFYQRRTVEACLELGKRLLVLKELSPHGEFMPRLDLLGFTKQTANRFMQAASKTAKSTNLGLLSTQVKSMSAFLELVMLDDGTLQEVAEMDDIDRLSASQLRERVRELSSDMEAKDRVLDDTQRKLTQLQVQTKKKVVALTDWPDALAPISEQISAAGRKIAQGLSELAECRVTIFEVGGAVAEELRPAFEHALTHVADLFEEALLRAERTVGKERRTFDQTLGAFAPDNVAVTE